MADLIGLSVEKVSVVIPVYGRWDLAKRNIDSLLKFDGEHLAEVIIVDDCSPEHNPLIFENRQIRVIRNDSNLGYTGTVNRGLKNAKSEIIILLDSDAFLIDSIIPRLHQLYDSDKTMGCIGFGTVDEVGNTTGSSQYEPSVIGLILGQQMESRFNIRSRQNRNILPYSCSVSFRKACLKELNYFDEKNFPVLEADNDMSMRIHRSRWKLLFTNKIVICHSGGNSYKIDCRRVLLFHKSRWRLLIKYNRIPFPTIAKYFLKARIRFELLMLKLLSFFQPRKLYEGKMHSRNRLLKEINTY